MTPADYQKTAGGGIVFGKGNKYLSEIFVESFIEWGGPGHYLSNEEIGKIYHEEMEPLLVSPEVVDQKKKIIKKIFEKWPMAKKAIKREDGKVSRMIEGVKKKDVFLSPVELIVEKEKAIKQEKEKRAREKYEERRKKYSKAKPKIPTIYDIIGPCPGEDKTFSAFDYIRKQPLEGWDTPEKREWFLKIRREILRG